MVQLHEALESYRSETTDDIGELVSAADQAISGLTDDLKQLQQQVKQITHAGPQRTPQTQPQAETETEAEDQSEDEAGEGHQQEMISRQRGVLRRVSEGLEEAGDEAQGSSAQEPLMAAEQANAENERLKVRHLCGLRTSTTSLAVCVCACVCVYIGVDCTIAMQLPAQHRSGTAWLGRSNNQLQPCMLSSVVLLLTPGDDTGNE